VFVDQKQLEQNIADMQALASSAGVRLRPHAKTHKSPVIARWQVEAGAVGICCAKLGEAEVFAEAGIADIRLPYPINPANAERVKALQDRVVLSIIIDDLDVARAWSHEMHSAGRPLDVLVKIDTGFHRCGVNPESPSIIDTIREVAGFPGLTFRGLLSHAGQGYGASSEDELQAIAENEIAILRGLVARHADGALHHTSAGCHRDAPGQLRLP
jgi:D-serine deaminase-like pyridoxal phosphate-dependent protein